jgi:hypothetical protein
MSTIFYNYKKVIFSRLVFNIVLFNSMKKIHVLSILCITLLPVFLFSCLAPESADRGWNSGNNGGYPYPSPSLPKEPPPIQALLTWRKTLLGRINTAIAIAS